MSGIIEHLQSDMGLLTAKIEHGTPLDNGDKLVTTSKLGLVEDNVKILAKDLELAENRFYLAVSGLVNVAFVVMIFTGPLGMLNFLFAMSKPVKVSPKKPPRYF